MRRHICLLALPLLSTAACLDMSDQDTTDGTSSQAAGITPAAVTGRVCETFGAFCVGAPTIAFEDPVVETTGGRILQIVPVAGGVNLAFNADTTRCVAVKNNSSLVEVRACSQASATWIPQRGPDGQSCLFQNLLGGFLSGADSGGQFNVKARGANGWFQQFINPGIACN